MSLVLFAAILQVFIFLLLVIIYYLLKNKYIIFVAVGFFTAFISSVFASLPFSDNIFIMLVNYVLTIVGFMCVTHAFLLVINTKLNKKITIPMVILTIAVVLYFKDSTEIKTIIISFQAMALMCITLTNYIKFFNKDNLKGLKLLFSANLMNLILYVLHSIYIALSMFGFFSYSDNVLAVFFSCVTVYQLLAVAGFFLVTHGIIEKQNEDNKEVLIQKDDYYNQLCQSNSLLDKSKAFLHKLDKIDGDKMIVTKEFATYMGMDEHELEYINEKEYFLSRDLFWGKYVSKDYKFRKITKAKIENKEIDFDNVHHIRVYRFINGKRQKSWFEISFVCNDEGGLDIVLLDITRLKNMIRTDYLTGTRNNVAFSEDFENKNFAGHIIAFADIDNFKDINDRFGHIIGDEVIVKTSKKLQYDGKFTVYRMSGDEFIFVSKKKSQLTDVEENIKNCIFNIAVSENNIPIIVSLSVGVIEYASHHNYSKDELLSLLDKAMYRAKKQKKKYAEITESYRDYENLFDSSALAQAIIDVGSLKVLNVNDAYVRMFKAKSKLDIIGKSPKQSYPEYQPNGETSKEFIREKVKTLLEDKYIKSIVSQLDFEGNELIVEMEAVVSKNNGVDILVITKKDITKQSIAEKKVEQLSERLNSVIESAKVLVWTIDYTKTPYTIWSSNNVKDFFDIEQDENGYINYGDWDKLLLETIGKEKFDKYKQLVFGKKVLMLDLVKFKNRYGRYNYLTFRSRDTKFDDRGKMIGLTGVVVNSNSDMEKLKEIEAGSQKINQLNTRLTSLLTTSNVVTCTFDFSDGKPKMWASDNAINYINVRQDEEGYIPYEDWLICVTKALKESDYKEYSVSPFGALLCEFEFIEFENKKGQTNFLSMKSVNSEFDKDGNLLKASFILMDTSSEAKKQKQLEINKHNFENIFEKTSMALAIVDMESGRTINCNEAFVKTFRGKSKDSIIGKVLGTYINSEIDNEKEISVIVLDQIEKLKESGSYKCEYNHLLNGKEEILLEVEAAMTEYNYKPAIVVSVTDITESKKITKLLQDKKRYLEENQLKYEMAEKGAKIASFNWDMQQDICYTTKEFVNIFGGVSTIKNA